MPNVRVVDDANTGDPGAFRTEDDRTAIEATKPAGTDLKVMAAALGFGILPDRVARLLRVEPSHPHAEEPEPAIPARVGGG